MNWGPDTRILDFIKSEPALFLIPVCSLPALIARQAASLMYYYAEASYHMLRPGYTPPRLIQGDGIRDFLAFQGSLPNVIDAFMGVAGDVTAYHYHRDPAVLEALQNKCARHLAICGLKEVPGIMEAIARFEGLGNRLGLAS